MNRPSMPNAFMRVLPLADAPIGGHTAPLPAQLLQQRHELLFEARDPVGEIAVVVERQQALTGVGKANLRRGR